MGPRVLFICHDILVAAMETLATEYGLWKKSVSGVPRPKSVTDNAREYGRVYGGILSKLTQVFEGSGEPAPIVILQKGMHGQAENLLARHFCFRTPSPLSAIPFVLQRSAAGAVEFGNECRWECWRPSTVHTGHRFGRRLLTVYWAQTLVQSTAMTGVSTLPCNCW